MTETIETCGSVAAGKEEEFVRAKFEDVRLVQQFRMRPEAQFIVHDLAPSKDYPIAVNHVYVARFR